MNVTMMMIKVLVTVATDRGGQVQDNMEGGQQYQLNPLTRESQFTHVTQDDHSHRANGPRIGAIGKPFICRRSVHDDAQIYTDSVVSRMEGKSLDRQYGHEQYVYNNSNYVILG